MMLRKAGEAVGRHVVLVLQTRRPQSERGFVLQDQLRKKLLDLSFCCIGKRCRVANLEMVQSQVAEKMLCFAELHLATASFEVEVVFAVVNKVVMRLVRWLSQLMFSERHPVSVPI